MSKFICSDQLIRDVSTLLGQGWQDQSAHDIQHFYFEEEPNQTRLVISFIPVERPGVELDAPGEYHAHITFERFVGGKTGNEWVMTSSRQLEPLEAWTHLISDAEDVADLEERGLIHAKYTACLIDVSRRYPAA
jgi:hypothetical protein